TVDAGERCATHTAPFRRNPDTRLPSLLPLRRGDESARIEKQALCKRQTSSVPSLLLSGWASTPTRPHVFAAGATQGSSIRARTTAADGNPESVQEMTQESGTERFRPMADSRFDFVTSNTARPCGTGTIPRQNTLMLLSCCQV